MGGFGSGRPAYYGSVEDRLQLDIRRFRREGWIRGPGGTMTWRRDGEAFASLGYTVEPGAVRLRYNSHDDDGNPLAVNIRIPVTTRPCRYGGQRHYWACPHCGRRCEVIVSGWGGRGWGCRKCLRLRYRSQALAPHDRMLARGQKILGRLKALEPSDPASAIKPKWMRWRTFNRQVGLADDLIGAADMAFMGRFLGRAYK